MLPLTPVVEGPRPKGAIDPKTGLPYTQGNSVENPTDPGRVAPPPKPVPSLPVQDPNNPSANVTLSPDAMSGAAAAPDKNAQVLETAQDKVLNQPGTSDLQTAYTQQATNFVNNPFGQWDPDSIKQGRMEKADSDWANAYEQQRQQFGNVSGSGLLQQNMLQNSLQHNVDSQALEASIDQENYDQYLEAMKAANDIGKSTEQQNQDIFSQQLGNLGQVRGMAEGERAQDTGFEYAVKLQANDFTQQLTLQTNSMNHDEKMAFLNAQYAEAKANGDVSRQKMIMEYSTTQELRVMAQQYGYDVALKDVEGKLALALQSNDAINADALMRSKWNLESEQRAIENGFTQARIDLEKAGVNMAAAEQTYNQLAAEVDAGRADPSTLTQFVQGLLAKAGVTIIPPDPLATQKAAQAKYDQMVTQYGLSHPGTVQTVFSIGGKPTTITQEMVDKAKAAPGDIFDGKHYIATSGGGRVAVESLTATTSLNPSALSSFNEFLNETLYGEESPATRAARANAGYLGAGDLPTAQDGDKFNLTEPTKDINGIAIPAGKYTTITSQETKEVNAGQYRPALRTYLVAEDGTKYHLKTELGELTDTDTFAGFRTSADPVLGLWED